jgi:hypothetical protein
MVQQRAPTHLAAARPRAAEHGSSSSQGATARPRALRRREAVAAARGRNSAPLCAARDGGLFYPLEGGAVAPGLRSQWPRGIPRALP